MHKTTLATLLLLALAAAPSEGGKGQGTSAPATFDTVPPEITILDDGAGVVYAVEDTIRFAWSVTDDNAAASDQDRVAYGYANAAPFDSVGFSAATAQTWDWTEHMVSSVTCWLHVSVKDAFGNLATADGDTFTIYAPASPVPELPAGIALAPPAPNPFNPRTRVSFDLDSPGRVTLAVFDLQGRLVKTLCEGELRAGRHDVPWTGRDERGRRVAGGPYLLRLEVAERGVLTRKVVLVQ